MSLGVRNTILALSLALAGCGGGINFARFDAKAKTFDIGPINNGSLQSDCEIVTGKALYQEQLMQCSIELQSHTHDSQKVYYTWRWEDSDGFTLAEEPWHFLALMGDEHKLVTGTATAPRAVKAEFLIRHRSEDDHEN
jgi:hypothetical protein